MQALADLWLRSIFELLGQTAQQGTPDYG